MWAEANKGGAGGVVNRWQRPPRRLAVDAWGGGDRLAPVRDRLRLLASAAGGGGGADARIACRGRLAARPLSGTMPPSAPSGGVRRARPLARAARGARAYCAVSPLHGFRYLALPPRRWLERFVAQR
ncbi:hypothetical protein R5R35_003661 [Gryllus longicercus]|uniref:Uncharacterized protein n=1 Tax=Gryllus longicercus TaxID=2509291 RepID=A0AAN9VU48_9ORTH